MGPEHVWVFALEFVDDGFAFLSVHCLLLIGWRKKEEKEEEEEEEEEEGYGITHPSFETSQRHA
jgi:hypothetical protein